MCPKLTGPLDRNHEYGGVLGAIVAVTFGKDEETLSRHSAPRPRRNLESDVRWKCLRSTVYNESMGAQFKAAASTHPVVDVIRSLEPSELNVAYTEVGSRSARPAMLQALLVYGYAPHAFFSRKPAWR
jgi:hypothetical protein